MSGAQKVGTCPRLSRVSAPPHERELCVSEPRTTRGEARCPRHRPAALWHKRSEVGAQRRCRPAGRLRVKSRAWTHPVLRWGEKRKKKKKYFPRNSPRRSLPASVSRHGLWSSALALHRPPPPRPCPWPHNPVQAPHCDALPAQGSDRARACRRPCPEPAPLWERSAPPPSAPCFVDSWRFINVGCPDGIWV